MQLVTQGGFCKLSNWIDGVEVSFISDADANRDKIKAWLHALLQKSLKPQKVTQLFSPDMETCTITSLQNKNDYMTFSLTDQGYLYIELYLVPPKELYRPLGVIKLENYVRYHGIEEWLLAVSPACSDYHEELETLKDQLGIAVESPRVKPKIVNDKLVKISEKKMYGQTKGFSRFEYYGSRDDALARLEAKIKQMTDKELRNVLLCIE